MRMKIGPGSGCCCGPQTCEIVVDDDLADYTQVTGTWTKPGSTIQTSDSDALILNDTPHPDGSSQGTVKVDLVPATTGQTRVLLASNDDGSDCIFFELEDDPTNPTAGNDYWVRIGTRNGGADTILEEAKVQWSNTLVRLCYNGDRVSVQMGSSSTLDMGGPSNPPKTSGIIGLDGPLTGTWGTKIGVEVINGTGTVQFSGVEFHGVNAASCQACFGACVTCDDSNGNPFIPATPREVSVYITGVVDNHCASCDTLFNGMTFILEPGAVADRACYFELPGSTGGCFRGGPGGTDRLRFTYGLFASTGNTTDAQGDVNGDGVFVFTRTSNRCDEVLSIGMTNQSDLGVAAQQCDWSGATITATPNVA